jgi:hypothetical protein
MSVASSSSSEEEEESPAPFLDYDLCDAVDLRNFVRDRTTFTAAFIRKLNKFEMVTHLEFLDTQHTFYRFMDLPPELRLNVYRMILFLDGEESCDHRTALLRVSKLVYRESEPVLYCDNSFCLRIKPTVIKFVVSESWKGKWDLLPDRNSGWPNYTPLSPTPVKIDMLFGLRQLTMRLSDLKNRTGKEFAGPGSRSKHPSYTYRSLTTICLMLSSASKLRTLTITDVPSKCTSWDVNHLTKLLFPIVFLPKTAAIIVKGGSPVLHTALEDSRRQMQPDPDHAFSAYGFLLSKAMGVLETARQQASPGTSMMLHVALDAIMKSNGCLSGRDLRSVFAKLQTLDTIVGNVEAELADL